MRKIDMKAIAACFLLSLAVFIGSTGLGYAEYRPLRFYDIFSLALSWVGLAFYMWRGCRASQG